MIVAKYKFNPNTYSDYLPVFNSGFTYTKSDVTNSDGTITRTIESSSLPTFMRFGETTDATDRSKSLLEILDMNTSNLTSMVNMFGYCKNLTSIVCNWNTSEVTNIREAFYNCSSLTTLNVNDWNTSNVTNMASTFEGCSSLTSLDINKWDTSKVGDMRYIFSGCSKLTTLDLSKWDTSQVTKMREVFYNCSSLTTLNVNDWNTSNVTDMYYMFNGCSSLTSLDLNSWDTSQVTNMQGVFYNCKTLTSLNVRNWNTSKVTNMYFMFQKCSKLTSLNVRNWNTSQVTNMENMFNDCSSLTSLDISNWNISNVTNSYGIFDGCSLLRKVALKYANQSTVSKIHENLPDRTSTTEGYILSPISLTSDKNWELLKFTHNEFYLPQPLRKVGDVKDRLYWDYDKGHYCIEQNIIHKILDGSYPWYDSATDSSICWALKCDSKIVSSNAYGIICNNYPSATPEMTYNHIKGISLSSRSSTIFIYNPDFIDSNNRDAFIQWINDNPLEVWYQLETPNIIDLTEMNKKFTFDTYLPNTNAKVTNLPIQPYGLLLKDDTVRYKSTIEPSTLYTIQFNCLAKSTTNLTLDLGGSRVTVEPIIGVNHVQITTPSVLASDRLFLIGTGIVIKEVIVNKGDMNQYLKYFDGEQSVGELQEDGSYIIRISTDNYTSLWEGDL